MEIAQLQVIARCLPCLILLGFLMVLEVQAGWVIEQVVAFAPESARGRREQLRQFVLFSDNRQKTTNLAWPGKSKDAWIFDLDAQIVTLVDYERHKYATGTVEEFGVALWGFFEAIGGAKREAMRRMSDEVRNMPLERRQATEHQRTKELMGDGPGRGAEGSVSSTESCHEPSLETRRTDKTTLIAGFPAVRFDILRDGKFSQEIWVSKEVTAWQELDLKGVERFSRQMAKVLRLLPRCGRGWAHLPPGVDPSDPIWTLRGEGYALSTVYQGDGAAVEVVKAETRAVPLEEFQSPDGFDRQTFLEYLVNAIRM